jgi:TRAP-type C4-dicarboxylate transport system permease small subunit
MQKFEQFYTQNLRRLVFALAALGGIGLVAMIGITCLDVALRIFKLSLKGTIDLMGMAGAVAIACALPYTTAVKGHVAVEYFFQKLGRRGRIAVDTLARLLVIAFFALLAWASVKYGNSLKASHEVSPTLELPVFWVPYVIAFCCGVVILVKVYHLTHPGKELIKP